MEFKENFAKPEDIGDTYRRWRTLLLWRERAWLYRLGRPKRRPQHRRDDFPPPRLKMKGNEELENWLAIALHPSINFRIYEGAVDGKPVALFEIPAAAHTPVRFRDFEYIRVGSYKKKLRDHPEKERQLWTILSAGSFENDIAHAGAAPADIIALLDHTSFFALLDQQPPPSTDALVRRFVEEDLIVPRPNGRYDIRNVAAILFARDLSAFGRLGRKAVRVVTYEGTGRTRALRERAEQAGYAMPSGRSWVHRHSDS